MLRHTVTSAMCRYVRVRITRRDQLTSRSDHRAGRRLVARAIHAVYDNDDGRELALVLVPFLVLVGIRHQWWGPGIMVGARNPVAGLVGRLTGSGLQKLGVGWPVGSPRRHRCGSRCWPSHRRQSFRDDVALTRRLGAMTLPSRGRVVRQ